MNWQEIVRICPALLGQSRIADSHRSLGLGLPLCRAILTAHGGTLTLRDNIPNGSVFSFALPQSEVNIHE